MFIKYNDFCSRSVYSVARYWTSKTKRFIHTVFESIEESARADEVSTTWRSGKLLYMNPKAFPGQQGFLDFPLCQLLEGCAQNTSKASRRHLTKTQSHLSWFLPDN